MHFAAGFIRICRLICQPVLKKMRTFSAKASGHKQDWRLVDAEGQILGRLAASLAHHLRGKHKPEYTPHVDVGDYIVVVNAEKIAVSTEQKAEHKLYHRHSGYPGGLKSIALKDMRARRPEQMLRLAVRGMLPRTSLGRAMLRKLKIYAGQEHPHGAQQPRPLQFSNVSTDG